MRIKYKIKYAYGTYFHDMLASCKQHLSLAPADCELSSFYRPMKSVSTPPHMSCKPGAWNIYLKQKCVSFYEYLILLLRLWHRYILASPTCNLSYVIIRKEPLLDWFQSIVKLMTCNRLHLIDYFKYRIPLNLKLVSLN